MGRVRGADARGLGPPHAHPLTRAQSRPGRADNEGVSTTVATDRALDAIAVLRRALAEQAAALAADEQRVDAALADYLERAAA